MTRSLTRRLPAMSTSRRIREGLALARSMTRVRAASIGSRAMLTCAYGITVVLRDLHGTLARRLLHLVGERHARAERQIVAKLVAHIRRKDIEPFEPDFFNGDGIVGNSFRRDSRARNEKGGSQYQDPPYVLYSFFALRFSFSFSLPLP